MDKISKLLRRRRRNERLMLIAAMELIKANELKDLDIKKMSGYKNLYRARIGKFRIIFTSYNDQNDIIRIDEKSDNTYRNL